jgi:hypothetical protein
MTDDECLTWGFILEVLDVMERHGYHRSDNQHTGQAIGLLGNLAHVYDGTIDAPRGGYVTVPTSPNTAAQSPGRAGQDAVVFTGTDATAAFAALDIAADYKRDRAAACAGCADQTCLTCQSRLRDAQAYDRLADQILHAAAASAAAQEPGPDRAQPSSGQPQAAADPEARQ